MLRQWVKPHCKEMVRVKVRVKDRVKVRTISIVRVRVNFRQYFRTRCELRVERVMVVRNSSDEHFWAPMQTWA